MATALLAGFSAFDVGELAKLIPDEIPHEVQENVIGRMLVFQRDSQAWGQLHACHEEDDRETAKDLQNSGAPGSELFAAGDQGETRFLLATYNDAERANFEKVVAAFAKAGVVQFECNDDEIRAL